MIVPRGSCTQVINTVKALKANGQFHHLSIRGLIDRDRRTDEEIKSLVSHDIFVLDVAEVENLFCTKEIIEFICDKLALEPDKRFPEISKFLFKKISEELETQISLRANSEIKFKLSLYNESISGKDNIQQSFNDFVEQINIETIFSDSKNTLEKIITESNYEELLKVYNRKSLSTQISKFLELTNGSLPNTVLRHARNGEAKKFRNMLKKYFGNFGQYINN
jgi:hypothetical protein